MPNGNKAEGSLTPPYFRHLVHLIRPFPNFDLFFIKSLRQRAAELLRLQPGDSALDVGCGPGGSFPYLVQAVGPNGKVVGVEISPEVTVNARLRIQKNEWKNVEVLEADAQAVSLHGSFDAILMFGAPDVYASAPALANLWPSLAPNARVVAFGAKLASRGMARILNRAFRWWFSTASFSSTPQLNYEPWALLAGRVKDLQVEEFFGGWMFLAWGSKGPEE